jgi:4-hydroxyacetophenone monooxygenase
MRLLERGAGRIAVTQEAFDRYNAALDAEAAKLVLMRAEAGSANNYYVNATHGRLQVNAPWYSPDYHRMCSEPDWSALEIT